LRDVPLPHRATSISLPDQRTLLKWLFGGRLILAVGALVASALVWVRLPELSLYAGTAVIFALAATVYGLWRMRASSFEPEPLFLGLQLLADLGLVGVMVHFLGPTGGAAPALYVLLIATYAVIMPLGLGVAMALAASGVFAFSVVAQAGSNVALAAQVVVFNVVFAVVALLGHRLRAAGLEHRTLETELQRVRLEAEVILRNIRSGVLTVDPGGRLAFINPTAQQLLHLDGSRVGQPVLDLVKLRSSELWAALVAGIRHGRKVSRGEGTVLHEGRQFPIGLSTTTFQQRPEAASSVTAIFTDISDSKQLQELQLRAERLEAVAALSASLAHEIRNPLASIRSSVEQLARSRYAGDDERTLAALIVRESDRLSRLLSEFLDFSRVRAARAEPVDLHAVISAAVLLVRAHPDCRPTADLIVEGGPTIVEGDEDLLHRTLVNLVLNAVQAAGEQPVRVEISVQGVRPAELPEGLRIEHPVRLRIHDNGPGVPEEIRERMFEPFVSRRPGGSGLGLAIVERAVAAHRGAVFVDSVIGSGTTFTIYLPATWSAEDVA
jgi:two-component system sensor histidine kinase PilS (NtrC family)